MKNKLTNLLWVILFSWIIILGSNASSTGTCDNGLSPCNQPNLLVAKANFSFPSCNETFQIRLLVSCTSEKEDFCCETRTCHSDEVIPFRTQGVKIQKQSINPVVPHPMLVVKNCISNSFFDNPGMLQTKTIYIITQSLLI